MRAATYRLQLHAGFTFDDAAAIAGYLGLLGVSHLYLSPVLQATPGSAHGYDVVDPTRVSDQLGGAEGHRRLHDARRREGLSELVDVVPNHMAIGVPENAWWWDVLEDGQASRYAAYFDVEWDPPESKLRNVVLLPILGDHYGRELENGRLALERRGANFVVRYFEHVVPLAPRSLDSLLLGAARSLTREDCSEGERDAGEDLAELATGFGRLPHATATDPTSMERRATEKETLRQRLATLCGEHPAVGAAIDAELAALQADVDALDALLDRQNYRLAWWRTAAEELGYRRFFDINDLIGLRVEDPVVFAATHQVVLEWLDRHVIDGVRIDHVDGLRDPAGYLERLAAAAPDAWILVEKILEGEENIPREWPVAGTTGYEWLNLVGDLLIHPGGWEDLVGCYRQFTGRSERGDEVVRGAKEAVLEGGLSADLTRLVDRLSAVCERHRRYRDFTRRDLRDCLRAVAVCFGVYRTYLRQGQPPSPEDVATIDAAVRQAGVSHPELDTDLLQFLRELLLGRIAGSDALEVAIRFQQLTGPVMAKAVEDTAFYRYLPLSSRNEVGGEPGHAPCGLEEFHGRAAHNHERHPDGLLALSSHDTKRSEDVRARLAVLAEIPADWGSAVRRWRSLHRSARQVALPDANTEWLFYQSLVGAWPIDVERLGDYLRKAAREAEEHTSWTDPDPVFEESLHYFVGEALGDEEFMDDVGSFVAGLRRPGWSNSLSQKLLTLTAPGVGDLYQGSECWDLSLVDPDNRRAVDYARRAAGLEKLLSSGGSLALQAWGDGDDEGLSKLLVVQRALGLRRLEPGWFAGGADGTYRPMEARGPAAAHAVAFCRGPIAREGGERSGGALSVATRLPVTLAKAGGWRDTRLDLPAGEWTDHLSGRSYEGTVELGALLEALPLALLATVGPVGE